VEIIPRKAFRKTDSPVEEPAANGPPQRGGRDRTALIEFSLLGAQGRTTIGWDRIDAPPAHRRTDASRRRRSSKERRPRRNSRQAGREATDYRQGRTGRAILKEKTVIDIRGRSPTGVFGVEDNVKNRRRQAPLLRLVEKMPCANDAGALVEEEARRRGDEVAAGGCRRLRGKAGRRTWD